MLRGQPLDLDHKDDGSGWNGLCHAICNRAAGARKTNRARAAALRATRGLGRTQMVVVRCALSVAVSEDRRHSALVTAGRVEGQEFPVIELVAYLDGTGPAPGEVVRLVGALAVVATVIDPHSQAATLIRPLSEAGVVVVEPSTSDVVVANGVYRDELGAGRLRHVAHPALEAAARAAELRPLAGAQTWDQRVATDVSPLRAATLALWGLLHTPPAAPEPMVEWR